MLLMVFFSFNKHVNGHKLYTVTVANKGLGWGFPNLKM